MVLLRSALAGLWVALALGMAGGVAAQTVPAPPGPTGAPAADVAPPAEAQVDTPAAAAETDTAAPKASGLNMDFLLRQGFL